MILSDRNEVLSHLGRAVGELVVTRMLARRRPPTVQNADGSIEVPEGSLYGMEREIEKIIENVEDIMVRVATTDR